MAMFATSGNAHMAQQQASAPGSWHSECTVILMGSVAGASAGVCSWGSPAGRSKRSVVIASNFGCGLSAVVLASRGVSKGSTVEGMTLVDLWQTLKMRRQYVEHETTHALALKVADGYRCPTGGQTHIWDYGFKRQGLRLLGQMMRAMPEDPMRQVAFVPNSGALLFDAKAAQAGRR